MSSVPQGVSKALVRMTISRRPYPPALTVAQTNSRAATLASGATASSRSRISASAEMVLAFCKARSFEPGM